MGLSKAFVPGPAMWFQPEHVSRSSLAHRPRAGTSPRKLLGNLHKQTQGHASLRKLHNRVAAANERTRDSSHAKVHEQIPGGGMNEPESRSPGMDAAALLGLPVAAATPPPSPRLRFAHDRTNPANPLIFQDTCSRTNPRSTPRNEPGDPMKGKIHERTLSRHKRTREPLLRPVHPHPTAPLVAGPPFLPY